MAHELDMTNGRANMAYVGATPWHGLGSVLTEDAPLETWMVEAGMAWNINAAPVTFTDTEGVIHSYQDRQVLYRSDSKAALSTVSTDYKVVQPKEVLEFFRDLIEQHGFKMETAGCLFGGRKFWALARVGETASIMGHDEINPYLMLATSCDGSMATAAHLTSVRVVCNNTLRMAIGADGKRANIRVPHSSTFDASAVKMDLGLVADAWGNFIDQAERLAQMELDRNYAIQLVAEQLKKEWKTEEGDDMTVDQMMDSSNVLKRIIRLYDGEGMGAEMQSAKGTAWGLVNAMTQFFDHETSIKGSESRAFERAHLTDRAKLKVTFADSLLALAA